MVFSCSITSVAIGAPISRTLQGQGLGRRQLGLLFALSEFVVAWGIATILEGGQPRLRPHGREMRRLREEGAEPCRPRIDAGSPGNRGVLTVSSGAAFAQGASPTSIAGSLLVSRRSSRDDVCHVPCGEAREVASISTPLVAACRPAERLAIAGDYLSAASFLGIAV